MAKLRTMTVEALRKLARQVLGEESARLGSKKALVAALEAAGVAPPPRKKASPGRKAGGPAKAGGAKAPEKGAAGRKAARAAKEAPTATAAGKLAAPANPPAEAAAPAEAPAPGVDPESYFVARVAGEDAARTAPHPMTEGAVEAQRPASSRDLGSAEPAGREEGLGELPWGYGDDVLVALPREPRTLFLYWDFAAHTVAEAFAGLEGGRAQLWIFARGPGGGLERVRTLDFALESRGFYVHDLEPGRTYLAEVHAVDTRGRERRVGRPSNEIALPAVGPSPLVDDRFALIPWELPLSRWLKEVRRGGPFSEELRALLARLSDWSRFAGHTWGGSAGGMGGRPFSPTGGPSSPHHPLGWSGKH
jgi:uncharacterized protein